MNNQNNRKKDKEAQLRTIFLTLSLSLILIAVLIAISAAFKRTADDPKDTEVIATEEGKQVIAEVSNIDVPSSESDTETTATTAESTTTESTSAEPSVAEPALPEFVAPSTGYVMKGHSGETPVFSATMNDYRPHIGVDISGSVGDDVYACAAGTIKEIWEDPMAGNCLSIVHDGGAVSIYRNLSASVPENVTVGAAVSAGEVVGSIGESSLVEIADEAHLHFELTIDGEQVDPAAYIVFSSSDTEYEG